MDVKNTKWMSETGQATISCSITEEEGCFWKSFVRSYRSYNLNFDFINFNIMKSVVILKLFKKSYWTACLDAWKASHCTPCMRCISSICACWMATICWICAIICPLIVICSAIVDIILSSSLTSLVISFANRMQNASFANSPRSRSTTASRRRVQPRMLRCSTASSFLRWNPDFALRFRCGFWFLPISNCHWRTASASMYGNYRKLPPLQDKQCNIAFTSPT